ncbi:MAG: sigma-70 family RNA polymerase sigma factor [Planctomycetota bacterium]
MTRDHDDTGKLLERAGRGDPGALDRLLEYHRDRLRQMVAVRLDQRLASRIDASDVVQEALAEAADRLLDYLRDRPLPFYLWLRELAWQRLVDLTRRHLRAHRRAVGREAFSYDQLSDASALRLAHHWIGSGTTPSGHMRREDQKRLVRAALDRLEPADRELVVLRHLEQLSTSEVAAVLNLSESTVRKRQRHVLEHLADLIRLVQ